jgi:hypothetical protein
VTFENHKPVGDGGKTDFMRSKVRGGNWIFCPTKIGQGVCKRGVELAFPFSVACRAGDERLLHGGMIVF